MDSLIWFSGWACIAVPLWLTVFGIYYIVGALVKYYLPAKRKGVHDDFSRN
jgi:uncharacterized membrane protein YhdT